MSMFLSHAPTPVRWSTFAWLAAIGLGIIETILLLTTTSPDTGGAITMIAIRTIVSVVMTFVILRMARSNNWARIVLAILLGGLGLFSLVADPIEWLMQGHSIGQTLAAITTNPVFSGVRTLHIIAVLTGLVTMFLPSAATYFKKKA